MGHSQKLPRHGRIDDQDMAKLDAHEARRGIGAVSNPAGRFEAQIYNDFDDGWWGYDDDEVNPLKPAWHREIARTLIQRNQSPDISFDRSINPYRGCEHGCIYCFARPSHAYLGHSAGQDFERELYFKANAVELLRRELSARSYTVQPIALGVNTDAYQPEERRLRITRSLLETLAEYRHPVTMITKSGLIMRDIDILGSMAEKGLARVAVSLTTLDRHLCRVMEPRAASPARRLATIRALTEAGIPVTVMTAPIIPALNEPEMEDMLEEARDAGASCAGYVLLRLPYELKDIFQEWLVSQFPDRAKRVINVLRSMRGGLDYDSNWQTRGRGDGPHARLIATRFHKACARLGLSIRRTQLRCDLFRKPGQDRNQMSFELED